MLLCITVATPVHISIDKIKEDRNCVFEHCKLLLRSPFQNDSTLFRNYTKAHLFEYRLRQMYFDE